MPIPKDNPAELEARLVRAIEALRVIHQLADAITDESLIGPIPREVREGLIGGCVGLIASHARDVLAGVTS